MSSVATGVASAVLKERRHGWDRNSGPFTEVLYEGTKDAIAGLAAELRDTADSYTANNNGALWQLTARFSKEEDDGGGESPVEEVRLFSHRIQKDILEHDAFSNLDADELQQVRKFIEDPDEESDDWPANLSDQGIAILWDVASGVRYFIVYQPVLVRTLTASSRFAFNGDWYQNVGRIISPGAIANEFSGTLPVSLPQDVSASPRRAFGWLKHYPEYVKAAGNKGVLSQEFEWGKWATSTYGELVV
jgi:hypothetical protein